MVFCDRRGEAIGDCNQECHVQVQPRLVHSGEKKLLEGGRLAGETRTRTRTRTKVDVWGQGRKWFCQRPWGPGTGSAFPLTKGASFLHVGGGECAFQCFRAHTLAFSTRKRRIPSPVPVWNDSEGPSSLDCFGSCAYTE